MTWLGTYRVRQFVRDCIWIAPASGMIAALVSVRLLLLVDRQLGWESGFEPESARALLSTLAASVFTLVVFVSSALLLAVQLASSQLTPRIIAIVFRDPVIKGSLTAFVFTFTLSLAVLVRIDGSVRAIAAGVAAYSFVGSLIVFLFLIDHLGKALRPSGVLRSVGRQGREVIASVYPRQDTSRAAPADDVGPDLDELDPGTVTNSVDGVVLAFDVRGLAALAERADCLVEMVPQVGDFVAAGDPLFRIYPGTAGLPAEALRRSICLGHERTMEQDPTFVFRILVDIAAKGLSPAINDPTTAVLAIDQIHHLLRAIGTRHLDEGRLRDASGQLRLVYRTPDWEDFVELAVTEIRHFGGQSIQVARRLRAMLENLIQTLPEGRASLLRRELALLHRSADRFFAEPEDRALAEVSDLQGVGGSQGHAKVDRRFPRTEESPGNV
jgi:uncharacterized membrane protein